MLKEFIAKQKAKTELIKAFGNMGLFKIYKSGDKERKLYPKIHSVRFNYKEKTLEYVFTLLNGMDPKELKKKEFVLKQHFGNNFELDGDLKKFVLTIFTKNVPNKISYNYEEVLSIIKENNFIMPVVCGKDRNGVLHIYDATNNPNLLIFGQPGSGKSSILHVILSTLIQLYSHDEIHLYLADFKMSEFNIYEGVKHVKSVSYLTKELGPALGHLKKELINRGKLLKQFGVRHVNKLPKDNKPPYIILAVDEFVMIKDKNVMDELLQIASLGRAYGIYLILSMQRPSHSILSTDVRGVLSVRMGFRTVDLRNALIGETPGSEKISKDEPGKFLLNLDELIELKSPYLDEEKTEKIIKKFKDNEWKNHSFKAIEKDNDPFEGQQSEDDIFNGNVNFIE